MPFYKKITSPHFEIALWRIEEDLSFFEAKFDAHPDIKNANQRLQWYATRHLANELLGGEVSILKDEHGKPFIENSSQQISLSHTMQFAAVMRSEQFNVGVDLEMVNAKVERIAHKFLREDELNAIANEEKIEKLILYWSAKEALYKLYGKGEIDFTTQLLIEPFQLQTKGELKAEIVVEGSSAGSRGGDPTGTNKGIQNLTIHYEFFEGHVLTYVIAR